MEEKIMKQINQWLSNQKMLETVRDLQFLEPHTSFKVPRDIDCIAFSFNIYSPRRVYPMESTNYVLAVNNNFNPEDYEEEIRDQILRSVLWTKAKWDEEDAEKEVM